MDDFLKKYKPFSRECFDHVRSLSEYTAEQEQKKKDARDWSHKHIHDYQLSDEEIATVN